MLAWKLTRVYGRILYAAGLNDGRRMREESGQEREPSELRHPESARAERRHVWFSVFLPFAIVSLIVVAVIGTVLSLRTPAQVSLLADSMLTVLVVIPLVLCMFPLVILSFVLVALLNRWRAISRSPLRRSEAWTALMEQNVEGWLGDADERALNWAVRLAPFRQLLRTFAAQSGAEGIE